MTHYLAKDISIDGNLITLNVKGKGLLTVDFSKWKKLMDQIGGTSKIKEVKLLGDLLEFPNDIHVEIEDFVTMAEQQKLPNISEKIAGHYL